MLHPMTTTPFPTVDRHETTVVPGLTVATITTTDEDGTSVGYTIDMPDEPLTPADAAVLADYLTTLREGERTEQAA